MADPTPEERARDVLIADGPTSRVRAHVAAEIRAAENAALERAASLVETWFYDRWPGAESCDVAADIRALVKP